MLGYTVISAHSRCLLYHLCQMPCFLSRAWMDLGEYSLLLDLKHQSLCLWDSDSSSFHLMYINREISLSWIVIHCQSASNDGMQVKSAEKDSDFKLENIILSENWTQYRISDLSPRLERFIFNYKSELNVRYYGGHPDVLSWSSTCFNISFVTV